MGGLFTSLTKKDNFRVFKDIYNNLGEVQEALQKAGLESSNLIIGIDYTKSNETQGKKTFGGKCLHTMAVDEFNPYQKVINVVGRTLEKFDEDKWVPAFGFGDITTKNHSVFPFLPMGAQSNRFCQGFEEVLKVYNTITPQVKLSGPTNFAPLIRKAIEIVSASSIMEYHILVIIADGMVVNEKETCDAIKDASDYPLSIIVVGVGDGPWDLMNYFDDKIKGRKFDNFQFVDYARVMERAMKKGKDPDTLFSLHALMEIPQQYKAIKSLGLMKSTNKPNAPTRTAYIIEAPQLQAPPTNPGFSPGYNPYSV